MLRRIALIVLALSLLAPVAACSSSSSSDGSASPNTSAPSNPVPGGGLVVGVGSNPDGFNPANNRWTPATFTVAKAVYDPLMVVDDNGKPQPYLIESVTPNPSNLEWTFKLRPGIKFHNGEAFDAQALKANLDNITVGLISGTAASSYWDHVDVVDPLTAKLVLKTPSANLPNVLVGQAGFMIAPEQLKSKDPKVIIGTGPFRVSDWVPDNRVLVKRNDDYWRKDAQGNQLPYLAEIKFSIITDSTSLSKALKAGDVDVVQTIDPPTIGEVKTGGFSDFQTLIDTKTSDKTFIPLNMAEGAFADKRARQAVIEATDQKAFIEALLPAEVGYTVAEGPFDSESPWGQPTNWPKYNPEHAKELVKSINGGKPVPVKLTVPAGDSTSAQQGQYLKAQWDAVGFDTTIDQLELNSFALALVTGKTDALVFSFWYESDPDALYHFFSSATAAPVGTFGLNFSRWKNSKVDAAIEAGRRSSDPAERRKQYQIVWDEMGNDLPDLFLFNSQWAIIWNKKVYNIGNAVTPEGAHQPVLVWGSAFYTNVWIQR